MSLKYFLKEERRAKSHFRVTIKRGKFNLASKRGVPPRKTLSKQNLLIRGVPAEYIEGTLGDYVQDDEYKDFFKKYLSNLHLMYEDRVNLCLYGANGTGKTFLSSLIVKEGYRLRYKTALITMQGLIDLHFKPNKTEEDWERIKMIREADFLVIDELGKENFTKSGSNINLLEETLRNAVTKGQVIIICTNLPLEGEGGLYHQYGASIKSLIDGSFVKLEFDNSDYRPIHLNKKRAIKLLRGEED